MFEEKANPEISWQSFKISKNGIENVDVTLGLGPLAARRVYSFDRCPTNLTGKVNFTNFSDLEKKQLVNKTIRNLL